MAMTKAEKQRMEELEKEVRLVRALRYSTYAPPKKIHVGSDNQRINGYLIFGSRIDGIVWGAESAVVEAWSESVRHGQGKYQEGRQTMASRDSCPLYRTRHDALIGLRLDKEKKFATILADIDRAIEAAAKEEIEND
jgi:hypothetical protein